jgi:molybdate transport system substrate-binding protein
MLATMSTVAGGVVTATVPAADQTLEGDLTVFAAASLTDAFEAIGEAFEAANPDVDVTFSFASSSDLVGQIVEGAPADVFASADVANMDELVDAEANGDEPRVFAANSLAIIVEAGNPLDITGVEDLAADSDLIVVSCAPEVPIGAYTQEVFANAGVEVEIDSFEENVRAVSEKVQLGEADAGVVYATDVSAAGDAAEGIAIPDDINVFAEYPIATTAESGNPDAAAGFVEFVLGEDGQAVLADFGFGSPDAATPTSAPDSTAP